jgi:WD40 repeat protein
LKRLDQGSPIHCVAALAEPRFVIAAGGPHSGQKRFGIVRKWDIDSGTFEDFKQSGPSTITALAADPGSGIVVAANPTGGVTAWDSHGQVMASRNLDRGIVAIALMGRTILVTVVNAEAAQRAAAGGQLPSNSILQISIDRIDETPRMLAREQPGRLWTRVDPSPDGRMLAFQFAERAGSFVVVLNRADGREMARFPNRSSALWSRDSNLVVFDQEVPAELMKVDSNGRVTRTDLLVGGKWHRSGTPADLTGRAVSDDNSLVWEVFRLGNTLAQCTLDTRSCDVLYQLPPLAYVMDVLERDDGLIATGGDDGFVRIWKQSDFSLLKEFRVAAGVPQGVALMSDGRTVVFSASGKDTPTEISAGDFASGDVRSLLKVPRPYIRVFHASGGFVYGSDKRVVLADQQTGDTKREFAAESKVALMSTSQNGEWLAIADDKGALYCFELKTGKRIAQSKERIASATTIAVTKDGQCVFTTEFSGALRRWQPANNSTKVLASVRGQTKALFVSSDGRRIAVGGNHKDIGIYDSKSGEALFYSETADSDFFVTNAWISGERLIFTTDAGVLFAGTLQH